MSRDAGGTYSLPAGNPVVSGATVDSSDHNDTVNDIASELTDSLSRSGKGGMSGALGLADGTVSLPGLTWVAEVDCGFYRIGADNYGFAIAGAQLIDYDANGPKFKGDVTLADFGTGAQVLDGEGTLRPVGLNVFPPEQLGAGKTIDLADCSKFIYSSDAASWTVTANNDADIPVGAFWLLAGSTTNGKLNVAFGAGVVHIHMGRNAVSSGTAQTVNLTDEEWGFLVKVTDTLFYLLTSRNT